MKELIEIQTRLVAPKNQTNTFGNYKYRNLESIMEAVKPLLKELGCTITFTDDLIMLGDRIFCKSTATLKNSNGEMETSTSFAELDNHKGMSKEQASGSSSSYSRKYAVCSLLAIDDNQDIDSMDNSYRDEVAQPITTDNATILKNFCNSLWKTLNAEEQEKMKKFNTYWNKRITDGTFKGTINPERLWQNEVNRAA